MQYYPVWFNAIYYFYLHYTTILIRKAAVDGWGVTRHYLLGNPLCPEIKSHLGLVKQIKQYQTDECVIQFRIGPIGLQQVIH